MRRILNRKGKRRKFVEYRCEVNYIREVRYIGGGKGKESVLSSLECSYFVNICKEKCTQEGKARE